MFTDTKLALDEYELFLFVSPEKRCTHGLDSLPVNGNLKRAWIVEFIDYDSNLPSDISEQDLNAVANYHQNLISINQLLSRHTSNIERKVYRLNYLEPFDDALGNPSPFTSPIVVDISCAPRGHLLSLLNYLARCQLSNYQQVVLMYSLVQTQSSSEEAYSYGMQDVAVVPGYNGHIRHKKDILIMALGFEGNRAFSLYRRLTPCKSFLILGDTQDELDREFYLDRARKNNYAILNIPTSEEIIMASRSPLIFYKEFRQFLDNRIKPLSGDYNVYFSCLGTKLQTVGAFLGLQLHPYIQVVDSLPTRRRIASEGKRQTIFADFGTNELIDQSIFELN